MTRSRATLPLLLLATGCRSVFGLDSPQREIDSGGFDPDQGVPDDAGDDAMPDGPMVDGLTCYGTGIVSICPSTTPTGTLNLSSTINTDTDGRCSGAVATYCVIMAQTISVAGEVRVRGSRPLVLASTGNLTIGGTLDAGSRRLYDANSVPIGEEIGAGEGTQAQCGSPAAGGNNINANAAGGGAGGSFGAKGGDGARGTNGSGGVGASALAALGAPTTLRGGCRGSAGGDFNSTPGGVAGHGGGAVYLIANGTLAVSGTVIVGGQGGRGGSQAGAGGAGGGSGGFIGLDGATLTCGGTLSANGGAGGEGGGIADLGRTGLSSIDATMQAAGGYINSNGGDGGSGSFTTTLTGGSGMANAGGGGGGGGGAGMIRKYRGATPGGGCNISPPLT